MAGRALINSVKKSAIVFRGKNFDCIGAFDSREETLMRAYLHPNFLDRLCCNRLSYHRVNRRFIKQV